jgi:CTP:molybdopterin cytidylyltransferase MocA
MKRAAAAARQDLACVLLAAGGSRRLGSPKQLLRLKGRALLTHAVAAARGALPGATIVVVLGAQSLRLRALVRRAAAGARVAHNASWSEGMAGSLQAGLRAVPAGTAAMLVTLVDQPHVDARALRRLVAAWRRRPGLAAAARYSGRSGVPAVLPRALWRAVRKLEGDAGARALLQGARVTPVEMPEAALDVDTAADIARLAKR